MALGVPPDVRETVMRVCSRQDVPDACRRHDLGTVIKVLNAHGVTQGRIAGLTGIAQGHLSEYKTRKRKAMASSTFAAFADGVGMPPAAREALKLSSAAQPCDQVSWLAMAQSVGCPSRSITVQDLRVAVAVVRDERGRADVDTAEPVPVRRPRLLRREAPGRGPARPGSRSGSPPRRPSAPGWSTGSCRPAPR